nr:nitronate monooxygenase [Duganella lactea]
MGRRCRPRCPSFLPVFSPTPQCWTSLVSEAPPVVSVHFGLLEPSWLAALRGAGCVLVATATSLSEALAIEAAGFDVVVAQGDEAGGHRDVFDQCEELAIGTLALTRLLTLRLRIPVVAAGGIMDGQGIAAVLRVGAAGAQLGTAFVLCPESSATAHHRQLLRQPEGLRTAVTAALSGRPVRALVNRYVEDIGGAGHPAVPDYPLAYAAAISLHTAAAARAVQDYLVNLAGQGFALAREMPAARRVETLVTEMGGAAGSAQSSHAVALISGTSCASRKAVRQKGVAPERRWPPARRRARYRHIPARAAFPPARRDW